MMNQSRGSRRPKYYCCCKKKLGPRRSCKRASGKKCENKPNGFCGKWGRCVTIQEEVKCHPGRKLMEIMYPNRKLMEIMNPNSKQGGCFTCGCRYNVQKCCCTFNYQGLKCND